jgi:glycerate 2-kinase
VRVQRRAMKVPPARSRAGGKVTRRRLVAAPDKFRGTASAADVAASAVAAALRLGWRAAAVPLADGGEGTLDAVGGERRVQIVTGPLGTPTTSEWRLVPRRDAGRPTAVIEMARASGLALAGGSERNDPIHATTRGTGELIAAAARAGAGTIVVGCGGSATTDGGVGMLEGVGDLDLLQGIELLAACDVTTPFLDAARIFGPQKGADPAQVLALGEELAAIAEQYRERFGVDVTMLPGSGAAGGLAGGLAAIGGRIVSGFDLIADLVGIDAALEGADLVVTGEGALDQTSLAGKVVSGVCARTAGRARILVVAGTIDGVGAADLAEASGTSPSLIELVSLVERFGRESALADAAELVGKVVAQACAQVADPA